MLTKKTMLLIGAVAFTTAGIVACSKKSDDAAAPAATVNEFSSLPEVTGPVSSNAPASIRPNKLNAFAATTGVALSSVETSTFTGKSLQMCENVNYIKEVLREAAGPDKILCYMGKMKETGVLPSSLNIGDGAVHYIKLTNLESSSGNSSPRVKFQIVKNGSSIETFKMWSCFSGTSDAPTQSEYISQTFSGTNVTVVTKNTGSESGVSYGSSMSATGTFESGSWTSKNITGNRYYNSGSSSNGMSINLDQYANTLSMQIAMGGVYGSSSFSNRFFTVVEILNGSKLSTIAIGDGSTKYTMSYDANNDSTPEFSETSVKSWNGDTQTNLSTASDGSLYTSANAGTVPSAPSATAVTFSGDEAWDCTAPEGSAFVDADFTSGGEAITTGMNECNQKFIDNNNWIQCPY